MPTPYGIVPTAGRGTRLRPLTEDRPKGMVEVAGAPLLAHVFDTLVESGIEELIVVVGYRKAAIIEHFGDAYEGVPITYVHQREQRGLGDAVLCAAPHVDGPFVVLNGDNVFEGDLSWLLDRWSDEWADADALLAVESVDRKVAAQTGVVTVDDRGRVTDIVEKLADPPTTLVTTGCYVGTPALFDALELLRPSDRGEYELTDGIGVLVRAGRTVGTVPLGGQRVNVNRPSDIERAEAILDSGSS